jgi:hypothetical protein
MHVPPKITVRTVAVVDVVVVSHRPPDGEGRSRRLAGAVVEPEPQFTGIHRVVERPTREGFEALELGAKVVEGTGVDSASQRVWLGILHRLTR